MAMDATKQASRRAGAQVGSWSTTGVALAFGLAAVFFAVFQGRTINHDTAYFLIATRQWLDGARLYADILEINPPLNFYYTAPALWLADATGLSATDGQYLLLAGLTAASLAWVWRILAAVPGLAAPRAVGLLVLLALAVSVPAAAHAGQREHLLVLFLLPWLVAHLALPVPDAGRGGVARAAFAAAGICLKPHFLLYPLAMTLWRVAATRSLRPVLSAGNLTIAGIGATYLAAVALIHPEYLDTVVPLAREVYRDRATTAGLVIAQLRPAVPALALLVLCAAWRGGLPRSGAAAAAVVTAAAIYLVQWKGYAYQTLPVAALSAVACLWLLAGPWRPGRAAAGLALACLGLIAAQAIRDGFYRNWPAQTFAPEVAAAGPAPGLAVLSTHLYPSFPLALATGARWTGRYPALWTLPGALNGLAAADCAAEAVRCARLRAILEETRGHVLDDLEAGRPDVLILHDRPGYIRDRGFDLRRFLSEDPRFGPFLAGYRNVRTVAGFEIWTRVPAPGPHHAGGVTGPPPQG